MLICNPCLTKYYTNKPSIRRLIGKCEHCSTTTERSEIPPEKLNPIIECEVDDSKLSLPI